MIILAITLVLLLLIGWHVLPWRQPPRPPPTGHAPRGEPSTKSLVCRAAVHEAGHAVAAAQCVQVRDITSVWIDDHGFNGRVEFDMVLADSNATNWCEAVLALSGLAAEAMIYRKFYAGHAEGDLLRALDRARKIEASGNVQPPWTPTTARYVDFRGVFDVKITDGELCILLAAYGKARLILDQRHEMHGRLVGALLTCRRLDRKAIRTCLGDRWAIRAFGFAMRECFV